MTGDEALRAACENCVTAASLLAAARHLDKDPHASDATIARILASGVVCGWAGPATSGHADGRGVTVVARGHGNERVRVRWRDIAEVVSRALDDDRTARLAAAYHRYTDAVTAGTRTRDRLQARVATVELTQLRAEILAVGLDAGPAQQSLFTPLTTARGRP
jgi:hypothetical protein